MSKYLVTGGMGFIGSNLVDQLITEGNSVVVMDNQSTDVHDNFYINPRADNHVLDVNHYQSVLECSSGVDGIFHLAAEARIQPAIENPILATKTNVLGTCNVLQAARENGVERVVFSSSSSVYGLTESLPNRETDDTNCLNPYSVSKFSGEGLCKMYYDLFGLETITFRYFNVYGERQPTKGQYAPVIGLFQKQFENDEPMTIVGDGFQRRDFTHVSDVVNANILAMNTQNEKSFGQVLNIGSGINYNIHDLVKMVGGDSAKYTHLPERVGESRETLCDNAKAEDYIDWAPTVYLGEWVCEKNNFV
tara:strand:- start:661 stop:1578 length:918 start_codon:yes stop_codon:yes gene_type:complete